MILSEYVKYTKHWQSMVPNILYFGSDKKITELKGKVFLTPYIGIASMFVTRGIKIKSLHGYYYNRGYKEWSLQNNKLCEPLNTVHITHNLKEITTIESGTAEGFIYSIDATNIKNKLSLYLTNDSTREVVYNSSVPLKIIKVVPHKIKWTCQFDIENYNNNPTLY